MILNNFNLNTLIFQIQYPDAFMLWDFAGKISKSLTAVWPGLRCSDGQPNVQVLEAPGLKIQTGLQQSVVTLRGAKSLDSMTVDRIRSTFDIWRETLALDFLSRVSTRALYVKNFQDINGANEYLVGLGLINFPKGRVFGQLEDGGKKSLDVTFRFEDAQAFSFLRFRSEELNLNVEVDPDFVDASTKRTLNRVVLDFDHGILGGVDAGKLRVDDWMKGYAHILRRDVDKFISKQG